MSEAHNNSVSPTILYQTNKAALIQISGSLQQKLESNNMSLSSRFTVSPTLNAPPAKMLERCASTAEPLHVIVADAAAPNLLLFDASRFGDGGNTANFSTPSLNIITTTTITNTTGSTSSTTTCPSPIFSTTTSLMHHAHHQHNTNNNNNNSNASQYSRNNTNSGSSSATGFVTASSTLLSYSSSSPTNSVDSGVSSPAASTEDADHHYMHYSIAHHYHNNNGFGVGPFAPGVCVRHHHRSSLGHYQMHGGTPPQAVESRFFHFNTAFPQQLNNHNAFTRLRNAVESPQLLQYCKICCDCLPVESAESCGVFRADEIERGTCRRSTLSPLCESPRDTNDYKTTEIADEIDGVEDNDKTITGAQPTGESAMHASILPATKGDGVFSGVRDSDAEKMLAQVEIETSRVESSMGKLSINTADSKEQKSVNAGRCICAPLFSTMFSPSISCSAPATPTVLSASLNFYGRSARATAASDGICDRRAICANNSTTASNNNNGGGGGGNGLKSILKRPNNGAACCCACNTQSATTKGRFRLSRSVSESASDYFRKSDVVGDTLPLARALKEMDLSGRGSDYFSSSQLFASSDVELMDVDAMTEEDESSRSSLEGGNCCHAGGIPHTNRSSTFDGSDSSMNAESADEKTAGELAPRKKRVSFSEHVQARIYRSSASILGQRKKNEKRNRTKRRRAESEGGGASSDDALSHEFNATDDADSDAESEGGGGAPTAAARRSSSSAAATNANTPRDSVFANDNAKETLVMKVVCKTCHKRFNENQKSPSPFALSARRDSGIDDEFSSYHKHADDNNAKLMTIGNAATGYGNGNSGGSRHIVVCEECASVEENASAAKRIRRLISADSALGDEDASLVTTNQDTNGCASAFGGRYSVKSE